MPSGGLTSPSVCMVHTLAFATLAWSAVRCAVPHVIPIQITVWVRHQDERPPKSEDIDEQKKMEDLYIDVCGDTGEVDS